MNKNSNFLVKTIIFILVIALACLIFFGLGSGEKTTMEIIAFSFITFAVFVIYLCVVLPSKESTKVESTDFKAIGGIHLIATLIINLLLFKSISDEKTLVIYNAIEIVVMLILTSILFLRKK